MTKNSNQKYFVAYILMSVRFIAKLVLEHYFGHLYANIHTCSMYCRLSFVYLDVIILSIDIMHHVVSVSSFSYVPNYT